jgi:hypothetical protein
MILADHLLSFTCTRHYVLSYSCERINGGLFVVILRLRESLSFLLSGNFSCWFLDPWLVEWSQVNRADPVVPNQKATLTTPPPTNITISTTIASITLSRSYHIRSYFNLSVWNLGMLQVSKSSLLARLISLVGVHQVDLK